MPCKALSTVSCTSNAKARLTQHVSVRVDGRESLSDVLHDGYEELLKRLMRSRPTAGERQEGMILRWGWELFGAEYNGLGLAMSEASKLLKATSAFDGLWTVLPWFSPQDALGLVDRLVKAVRVRLLEVKRACWACDGGLS